MPSEKQRKESLCLFVSHIGSKEMQSNKDVQSMTQGPNGPYGLVVVAWAFVHKCVYCIYHKYKAVTAREDTNHHLSKWAFFGLCKRALVSVLLVA